MSKRKKPLVSPQWFYLSFFGGYFVLLYLALYQANGLQPFQVSHHFASNVIGSLSTRFLSEVVPYVIFLSVAYYSKRKWLRVLALVGFLAFFLVNLVWIGYYFFVKTNLQIYVLEALRWSLIKTFFTPGVVFALLATLALVFGLSTMIMGIKAKKGLPPTRKVVVFGLLIMLAGYQAYFTKPLYDNHIGLFGYDSVAKKTFSIMQMDQSGAQRLAQEMKDRVYKPPVIKKELSDLEKGVIDRMGLDTHLTTHFPNPPKKIVLVVVESLNQSFLSAYNPQIQGATPFLDEMLEKYARVDQFYPSGPFTIHGLSSMLCGHTNIDYGMKLPKHECLPKLLTDAGYRTEFIRGFSKYYIGENVIFKKFGFSNIFAKEDLDEKFPSFKEERPDLYDSWGFSDDYLFDEAVLRLEEAKPEDKLFLTLLTVDTHTPGGRCYDQKPTKGENLILFSVNCFDRTFERFMGQLEEKGLLNEDTLVLLTSDQLLPNHSKVPGDFPQTSFVFPPSRIPFLMITKAPLHIQVEKGSQVDIASTVLDAVNLAIPTYYMGKSLISDPFTLPTGRDGANTYAILGDQFNYFPSLHHIPKPMKGAVRGQVRYNSDEDLELKLEAMRKEREAGISENAVLQKWYYNRYYYHDINP